MVSVRTKRFPNYRLSIYICAYNKSYYFAVSDHYLKNNMFQTSWYDEYMIMLKIIMILNAKSQKDEKCHDTPKVLYHITTIRNVL